MTELCLMVAEQSLRLSGIILFLWVLRALLRRIPARPCTFFGSWYLPGCCFLSG